MKRIALCLLAAVVVLMMAETVSARPVAWRYYRRPVAWQYYRRPVAVSSRRPVVVYQPTRVVYTRQRPILGGTVVRSRPAYRRTVMW
jgi:hypothetical protein